MSKVSEHLKKHKAAYITGGVCLGVGLGAGVIIAKTQPAVYSKNQIVGLVNWKPKQTIEVFVEALGDPGNIIQDLDTGTIYASQGQAARALGVDPSTVSKHLKGLYDNAGGHTLKNLGKAAVV